ncbi:MAG: D-aminoacyl-tRNA deacylase [Vicinamibacterales bacterium]
MRAVIQRVSTARVTVDGNTVGEIGNGLLVLLGVTHADGPDDARYIAGKVAGMRIFEDDAGKMNRSVSEAGGAILVVSQFTLYGDCRKGRRPSFDAAAPPLAARQLYDEVVRELRRTGLVVQTGTFQARMKVELANDGPVTFLLSSEKSF